MKKLSIMAALLCLFAMLLTACGEEPNVTIINVEDDEPTTTAPSTATTDPEHRGQLTISALMVRTDADMKWSWIKPYDHTVTEEGHALFKVSNEYGKECDLNVTFDEATDVISEAVLSYGDTSVSVLTEDTFVIRTVLLAMNEE